MKRIDLDDLPPRAAALLAGLEAGEELLLARGDMVIGRLAFAPSAPSGEDRAGPPKEADMAEVMEQFRTVIEDEF